MLTYAARGVIRSVACSQGYFDNEYLSQQQQLLHWQQDSSSSCCKSQESCPLSQEPHRLPEQLL